MKKLFIIALASLFAFASCSKESNETPEVNNVKGVVLTFKSKRPQLKSGTKTEWDSDNSSIVWSATDKIKVGFTYNDNWWAQTAAYSSENESPNNHVKFYQSGEVSIDDKNSSIGTFTVPTTFTGPTTSGSFVFYAIYPAALIDNSLDTAPNANVTLKTSQNPGNGTFDASTDIMVGTSSAITSTGLPEDPISLNWTRVVSHLDLTFSNIAFDGTEIPQKITLTFNEEAKVAGSFSVNMADGTIGAGAANEITLEGNGLTVSGTSIKAWATVLPVSFSSLNVEVKTDKATYTRSITGISKTFKKNARNTLTINMTGAVRTASAQYDWVVKDLSEITSSDVFVIVGNNGSNYAMNHTSLNSKGAPNATAVTVTGTGSERKLSTSPIEGIQWNLSSDSNGYIFYPNGDNTKWLNLIADNNGIRVNNTAANGKYWTLDASTGYLKGTDTKEEVRYIGVYSSTDWRSYTSTGGNIAGQTFAFYVKSAPDTRKDPALSFSPTSKSVAWADKDTYEAPTLNNTYGVAVNYSSSDETVATVGTNGSITFVGNGTTTITAEFAGNPTYKPSSATYSLTVTGKPAFTTVAELNNLATTTGEYSGTLSNAVVSYVPDNKNAVIKDATGSILVFKTDHGLLQGKTFTGEITATVKIYHNCAQITDFNATFTGDETTVEPETMTLATLNGNLSTYQNAYVQVSGLEVTNIASDNKTISVKNGDYSYVVYSNNALSSGFLTVGDIITATGTITWYSEKDQIKVWNNNNIVKTGQVTIPTHTISWSAPSNGSFTVKVDGSTITSGTEVAEGKTVTLIASPNTGYAFSTWSVSGATVSGNTPTATFVVGSSNVSISATFVASSTASVTYDFTGTDWSVSNGTLTNGTVSFTGEGAANFKMNDGYFIMGKSGAYLTFPAYSSDVEKIVVTGRSGASGSVVQNIFVGNTAVSTATTGATGANTYEIASGYQAAGTTYVLKVTSNHNTQITKIEVFYK